MGTFSTICGWLELNDDLRGQVERLVYEDREGLDHYTDSWYFPEIGGGYSRFAFFGCTVRDSAVSAIRRQVARIAKEVVAHDGDDTDYVVGLFKMTLEDESAVFLWKIGGGEFRETKTEA